MAQVLPAISCTLNTLPNLMLLDLIVFKKIDEECKSWSRI